MGKFLIKFSLFLITIIIIITVYLSYFGLETDKFDDLIKNRANEVNKYVKLGFNKTKIYLNPSELNLAIKLQNPKILIKNNEILLSKLDLYLPLKSFITSDFLLKRTEVAFIKNDIKDLTKITNIFLPKFINNQLKKVFAKGNLEGEIIIPFETNGEIGKDYGFSGKISDASINLTKELSIKNLTTEINHLGDGNGGLEIKIEKGSVYDLILAGSIIKLNHRTNKTSIKSILKTNGKLNSSQIKKISTLLNININNFENINGTVNLDTKINFDLNNRYKVKNLSYSTEGRVNHLQIDTHEQENIKKYLPGYDPKFVLKDCNVKFINSKSNHVLELDGYIKVGDNFDPFKVKEIYNYDKKTFKINGAVDLTNSEVKIPRLNYDKKNGQESKLNFDINFVLDKFYFVKNLNFSSKKTKITLSNIKLNKNFEVEDFQEIEVKTFKKGDLNNNFIVKKSKKIDISGTIFDAQPLLKSLFKRDEKKTFSKNFTSEIKINFEKTLTGTDDNVLNFTMIASIANGSYNKLSLKGNFSEKEIVEMSIYQIDKDKKTLQVFSDRARPFMKNFDFIKGFEGGKLEYESTISKEISNSTLMINDFKVSKVPALAQLLSLASLQGIADTLSGEGIRF